MARKGILVSDPSVRLMTKAQWYFEYIGLVNKEITEQEHNVQYIKLLRVLLVKVLGLDLLNSTPTESDLDKIEYAPLSLFVSRPHILEKIEENSKKRETVQAAMQDDTFDQMSAAMASGVDMGDMAPISDLPPEVLKSIENIQADTNPFSPEYLKSLGVKIAPETQPVLRIKLGKGNGRNKI